MGEIKCIYCAEEQRVLTFNELKPGDHISLAGEKLKFNAFNKQFSMYKHHALIKALIQRDTDGSSAMVTMIHFIWTPFSKLIEIRETTDKKSLYNDEIYKHIYRFNTDSNITINRANELEAKSKKNSYSVLYYNCEHMVRWCIANTTKSLQVDSLARNIVQLASLIPGFIGILNLISVIEKRPHLQSAISGTTNRLTEKIKNANMFTQIAVTTLAGMTLFNLLMSIYSTCRFYKKFHQSKLICKICYSQKKWEIWLTFGAFVISNLGFGLLNLLNTKLPSGWFFLGSVIMSVVSMHLAQNTFVALKSPFRGSEVQVNAAKLKIGDVIKYYYWKIPHVGIVADIVVNEEKQIANLSILHYAFPSVKSSLIGRTIIQENTKINMTKDKVWRLDFSGYDVHDAKDVVRRAKLRIREKKFGFFSNRSSHFCFWAKVVDSIYNDDENIEQNQTQKGKLLRHNLEEGDEKLPQVYIDHRKDKLVSTNRYEKRAVRISDEIKPGDLIEIKFNYLFHKVICTEKRVKSGSNITLSYVHYGSSHKVCEETNDFDLIRDTINIYLCHPVHRYPRKEIINRAREKIGEQKYCIFSRRASHLADEIVSRGDISKVVAEKVISGNAIMYRYWGSWHEAIVTSKENIEEDKIKMTIVFDRQKHRFATREIITEKLIVKSKSLMKKKEFKGYYTYPDIMSVVRALSRTGEKRFSVFGNKSSDFVHWCKVFQTPFVYSFQPLANEDRGGTPPLDPRLEEHKHVVVIPLTGKVFEEPFHINWIKTKEELTRGSILKLKGQFAILKSIKGDRIEYVFYTQSQEAVNIETNFKIDLKNDKERIWIYYCNPKMCRSRDDIINRITKSLETEEKVPAVSSAWEFCKWCVLKTNAESFYKTSINSREELNLQVGSILKVREQFGILTSITNNKVELVCYNQTSKKVKLSRFEVDFKRKEERIWKYWCTPRICYRRHDISMRASTCLQSKDEIPAVKSAWEFCKWCVLIENSDSFDINLLTNRLKLDTSKGTILKVKGQFGILDSIHGNTITLVCYYNQSHEYIKRTSFKLKNKKHPWLMFPGLYKIASISQNSKNLIWTYEGARRICNSRSDIINRASKCLINKYEIPAVTSDWEFCQWCVLKENAESFYKKLIQARGDLTIGSIYKVKGQLGILTSITGSTIELVFYKESQNAVYKDKFNFDLQNKKESIWLYWASSSICHARDDIIERASNCEERKGKVQAFTSAWEFCKCCVLIQNMESFDMESFDMKLATKDEIKNKEGSILKVEGQFGISKSITENTITLVCYNLRDKVTFELKFKFDELHEPVWIYHCSLRTLYQSSDIVIRASTLKIANSLPFTSSWDFSKWCVQKEDDDWLKMQSIRTWQELGSMKGSILQVEDKYGILESIKDNTIKVLWYDTSQNAVKKTKFTVYAKHVEEEEDNWLLTCLTELALGIISFARIMMGSNRLINFEHIRVYQCDSSICHTRGDIIERALKCFRGEAKMPAVSSALEFCEWCVRIETADAFRKQLVTDRMQFIDIKGSILRIKGQFGIVKSTDNEKINIVFFNQSQKAVNEDGFIYNLKNTKEPLFIYEAISRTCYTHDIIIQRACQFLTNRDKVPDVSSAWEFCLWCVLEENA